MSQVTIRNIRAICTAPQPGNNLVVVKVETSEPGLYGLGCATYTQRHLAVVNVIENYLTPLLVGRSVNDITDNWKIVHQNPYWRNGPVLNNALSGVDEALWDIKGKMANMPVYELLGGKCREGAYVYRHADGRDLHEVEDTVHGFIEDGFRFIRVQMGNYGGNMNGMISNDLEGGAAKGMQEIVSPKGARDGAYYDPYVYLESTVKLFDHMRSKFGEQIQFCHDVHERLVPIEAIRLAKELEPYHPFFLEDALPPEQTQWFDMMRAQTSTPIAIGELFNNPMEYNDLISQRRIDFIRCHISQIGGLSPAIKLAGLCEAFGVRTAWHGPADLSPVGAMAQLHLELASPNFGVHECNGFKPAVQDVFPGCPTIENGYLYANDKPGFGIDIDEKEATKYPCSNEVIFWTQARRTDGTVFTP